MNIELSPLSIVPAGETEARIYEGTIHMSWAGLGVESQAHSPQWDMERSFLAPFQALGTASHRMHGSEVPFLASNPQNTPMSVCPHHWREVSCLSPSPQTTSSVSFLIKTKTNRASQSRQTSSLSFAPRSRLQPRLELESCLVFSS